MYTSHTPCTHAHTRTHLYVCVCVLAHCALISPAPRGTHLWEFIRDILIHPERNQGLMKWEDRREGVFKFLKSEAVAQMWGQKKKNSSMTYEKLSRAMRWFNVWSKRFGSFWEFSRYLEIQYILSRLHTQRIHSQHQLWRTFVDTNVNKSWQMAFLMNFPGTHFLRTKYLCCTDTNWTMDPYSLRIYPGVTKFFSFL